MISKEQHEILADIFNNSERPDKMTLRLDPISRTMFIEYSDLDFDWFRELSEVTPNAAAQPRFGREVKPNE